MTMSEFINAHENVCHKISLETSPLFDFDSEVNGWRALVGSTRLNRIGSRRKENEEKTKGFGF